MPLHHSAGRVIVLVSDCARLKGSDQTGIHDRRIRTIGEFRSRMTQRSVAGISGTSLARKALGKAIDGYPALPADSRRSPAVRISRFGYAMFVVMKAMARPFLECGLAKLSGDRQVSARNQPPGPSFA
jgi:hypothetical protein